MTVTLGVEEELQVVDARTSALVPHDIARTRKAFGNGPGGIASEIHQCTIELQTPIATGPDEITLALLSLRDFARKQAAKQGQSVLSAGLHPFSPWQDQKLHDDPERFPHYANLLAEYGDIARSAMSFGLHVHLGLPDPKLRMPVMNRLRSALPEVLALSVNAPFHEKRDTGLESWRHSVLGRYPRMGIPDIWPDEASYVDYIDKLRQFGSIRPDRGLWDDLRLHHRYGTLEVRICDAVFSLERLWLIVALLQCETMTLVEEAQRGTLADPEPRVWIEENKWRARRYGMGATFVDWRRNENVAAPIRYERWLARLLPAAVKLGLWPRVELAVASALSAASPAQQQRKWFAATGTFEGLVKHLVDATAEPWIAPTPIRRHRDVPKPPRKPARKPRPVPPANLRSGRAVP